MASLLPNMLGNTVTRIAAGTTDANVPHLLFEEVDVGHCSYNLHTHMHCIVCIYVHAFLLPDTAKKNASN